MRLSDEFDAVLIDSTEFNMAESLFTDAFYSLLRDLVQARGGVIILNTTSLSWHYTYAAVR